MPVRVNDISKHSMHSETYQIPEKTFEQLEKSKENRTPIVAVGTTSFRALESFYGLSPQQRHLDQCLDTDLYLYPKEQPYKPHVCNGIFMNFHQPESSLLMLICSLLGKDQTMSMYKNAIENDYRFFSYGDASLLWL